MSPVIRSMTPFRQKPPMFQVQPGHRQVLSVSPMEQSPGMVIYPSLHQSPSPLHVTPTAAYLPANNQQCPAHHRPGCRRYDVCYQHYHRPCSLPPNFHGSAQSLYLPLPMRLQAPPPWITSGTSAMASPARNSHLCTSMPFPVTISSP